MRLFLGGASARAAGLIFSRAPSSDLGWSASEIFLKHGQSCLLAQQSLTQIKMALAEAETAGIAADPIWAKWSSLWGHGYQHPAFLHGHAFKIVQRTPTIPKHQLAGQLRSATRLALVPCQQNANNSQRKVQTRFSISMKGNPARFGARAGPGSVGFLGGRASGMQ